MKSILFLPVLVADYSGQLAVLLRYPRFDSQASHHTPLLVRQAMTLQLTPKPSTGAMIMMENRTVLDMPVEVAQEPPQDQPSHIPRTRSTLSSFAVGSRPQQPSAMYYPELIARGLLERGESLGLNKTVMSAVSELRVTL